MGIETVVAVIAGAAVGLGTTAVVNKASSNKGSAPSPQPLPQAPSQPEAAEKGQEQARKRKGAMSKTVYTSPLGLSQQEEAGIVKKTLTGA